jgi:pre-mRNA-splicing factor CDC5/CEF1
MYVQDIEANLLKQDMAKAKLREQHDQPAAVAKALELNDAAAMRRRGRMMLPAPQVSITLVLRADPPCRL